MVFYKVLLLPRIMVDAPHTDAFAMLSLSPP